jgi:hypothetical protein
MDQFPVDRASGSGSTDGYTVEARLNYNGRSEVIAGVCLGPTWVTLDFQKAPAGFGVPQGNVGHGHLPYTDLLAYPSAQALRWWFLANAYAERKDTCLETRLIKHTASYSFKEVATGVVDLTDGAGRFVSREAIKAGCEYAVGDKS